MNPFKIFYAAVKCLFIKKPLQQSTNNIYKSLTDLSSDFIKPFFITKKILTQWTYLKSNNWQTTYYDTNSILSEHVVCKKNYGFPKNKVNHLLNVELITNIRKY